MPAARRRPAFAHASFRGPWARVLTGLWMLLHLAVVGGAPLADGLVDHEAAAVVHVEDADGGDCPTPHDAEGCHLCQLAHGLRAVLVEPPTATAPALAQSVQPTAERLDASSSLAFLAGRSTRAPPLG